MKILFDYLLTFGLLIGSAIVVGTVFPLGAESNMDNWGIVLISSPAIATILLMLIRRKGSKLKSIVLGICIAGLVLMEYWGLLSSGIIEFTFGLDLFIFVLIAIPLHKLLFEFIEKRLKKIR